jgi:putative FmdB family regulatory protein
MPIYEYHCRECDNKFEKLVSMSTTEADIECPSCQKNDVEKVLSVFASTIHGTSHVEAPVASTGCTTCSTPFRTGWGI